MTSATPNPTLFLPDRLEDAKPGSRVGELVARWRHTIETAAPDNGQLAALRARLAKAQATVRDAGPDSDFVQVAAATAEIPVLERHIEITGQQVSHAHERELYQWAEAQRCFTDYLRLRRILTGQAYGDDDRHPDSQRPRDVLRAMIAELVGATPA